MKIGKMLIAAVALSLLGLVEMPIKGLIIAAIYGE